MKALTLIKKKKMLRVLGRNFLNSKILLVNSMLEGASRLNLNNIKILNFWAINKYQQGYYIEK